MAGRPLVLGAALVALSRTGRLAGDRLGAALAAGYCVTLVAWPAPATARGWRRASSRRRASVLSVCPLRMCCLRPCTGLRRRMAFDEWTFGWVDGWMDGMLDGWVS